jgi:DinB superfamily
MRSAIVVAAILLPFAIAAPSAAPLTPLERQRLIAHLDMTERWLADEVSGLSPAQLAFKPRPDAWNILQVVDHLVVVGPIYWRDLQQAVKGPASKRLKSDSDEDILWYGIDRTNREKAIPSEVPNGQLTNLRPGLDQIRKQHAQLRQYIATTSDDLRGHVVERQGSDAYQWALLISTHEQRHILQIREIKADRSFPTR